MPWALDAQRMLADETAADTEFWPAVLATAVAAGAGLERSAAIPLKLIDVEKSDDGGVLLKYLLERSI